MRKIFIIALSSLIISGCGLLDSGDDENIEITKRIFFTTTPAMSRDSSVVLHFLTEEQYAHGGFTIELYSKLEGNRLDIYIAGVKDPPAEGVYTMALAPASAYVPISSLKGEYELVISSSDFTDIYKLVVVNRSSAYITGRETRHTKPY